MCVCVGGGGVYSGGKYVMFGVVTYIPLLIPHLNCHRSGSYMLITYSFMT